MKRFIILSSVLLLSVASASFSASAQSRSKMPRIPVKLAAVTTGDRSPISMQQLKDNPQLSVVTGDCVIKKLSYSIMPAGKNYIGPFVDMGSKLDEKSLELISQKYKGKIFLHFEDIYCECAGKEHLGESFGVTVIVE